MKKTYKIINTDSTYPPFDEEDIIFTNKKEAQAVCDELNDIEFHDWHPTHDYKLFIKYYDHFEVVENN